MPQRLIEVVNQGLPREMRDDVIKYFVDNPSEASRRLTYALNNTFPVDLCVGTRFCTSMHEEGCDAFSNVPYDKQLTQVVIHRIELVPFVGKGELPSAQDGIDVKEMLARAEKLSAFGFGDHQGEALLKHQYAIPAEWRQWELVLPGTFWQKKKKSARPTVAHLTWRSKASGLGKDDWAMVPDWVLPYGYDEHCRFLRQR